LFSNEQWNIQHFRSAYLNSVTPNISQNGAKSEMRLSLDDEMMNIAKELYHRLSHIYYSWHSMDQLPEPNITIKTDL
jgi:hypothetical protein